MTPSTDQFSGVVDFPLGLVLYVVLMRAVVLQSHRQAEIDSGFEDQFLATSRGASWADIVGSYRLGRKGL